MLVVNFAEPVTPKNPSCCSSGTVLCENCASQALADDDGPLLLIPPPTLNQREAERPPQAQSDAQTDDYLTHPML